MKSYFQNLTAKFHFDGCKIDILVNTTICTHLFAFHTLRLKSVGTPQSSIIIPVGVSTFLRSSVLLYRTLLHFYAQTNGEPVWVLVGFSTLKTKLMRRNWTLSLRLGLRLELFDYFFFQNKNNPQNVSHLLSIFFLFSPPICFISFGKSANGMEEKLESYLNNPLDNE